MQQASEQRKLIAVDSLKRFSLDKRALAWIRERLANVNVFSDALDRRIAVTLGEVFTLAPQTTKEVRLYEFDAGGLLPGNQDFSRAIHLPDGSMLGPVDSLLCERARFARDALESHPGAICIVNDVNPRWGELTPEEAPVAFGVGEEVYHLLTLDHDERLFEQTIKDGDALWHGVAAVSTRHPAIDASGLAVKEEMQAAAHDVIEFTVTAYDGEGFLCWRALSPSG